MWMVFDEFKRFKCDGKIGCVQDFICKLLILFDANVIGFFVFCIFYCNSLKVIYVRIKKSDTYE